MRDKSDQVALYFVGTAIVALFSAGIGNFAWVWTSSELTEKLQNETFHSLLQQDIEYA